MQPDEVLTAASNSLPRSSKTSPLNPLPLTRSHISLLSATCANRSTSSCRTRAVIDSSMASRVSTHGPASRPLVRSACSIRARTRAVDRKVAPILLTRMRFTTSSMIAFRSFLSAVATSRPHDSPHAAITYSLARLASSTAPTSGALANRQTRAALKGHLRHVHFRRSNP